MDRCDLIFDRSPSVAKIGTDLHRETFLIPFFRFAYPRECYWYKITSATTTTTKTTTEQRQQQQQKLHQQQRQQLLLQQQQTTPPQQQLQQQQVSK